jgi:hypothetical protein
MPGRFPYEMRLIANGRVLRNPTFELTPPLAFPDKLDLHPAEAVWFAPDQ